MTSTKDILAPEPAAPTEPPPDWTIVHFDVRCARCGADVKGRDEPRCPACGLGFRWSQAVPLEQLQCPTCRYSLYGLSTNRCPECGKEFDWNEVLTAYLRSRKALFEYQWREHPLRSLVRTWSLSLRPGLLWRYVEIHDPPRVGPLIGWCVASLALAWFVAGAGVGGVNWISGWGAAGNRLFGSFNYTFSVIVDYFVKVVDAFMRGGLYYLGVLIPVWWVCTFGALMVFQQSMRMFNVRTAHVVRVCSYTMTPLIPLALAVVLAIYFVNQWRLVRTIGPLGVVLTPAELAAAVVALIAIVLLHALISIGIAYGRYLRMPHAFGIAAASQLIALLCVAITMTISLSTR